MRKNGSDAPLAAQLRRFALLYLPVVVVLSAFLLAGIRYDQQMLLDSTTVREKSRVDIARVRVAQDFSAVESDLRVIANLPLLQRYLDSDDPELRNELEKLFLVMSRETKRYDQIRYLDASGLEVIRINYNDGKPAIVPRDKLQNKLGRYYFNDAYKLDRDEMLVSPIDLNIEHDQLEIPYKPMIRFGMPVFDSAGHKKGIVLLNYFGKELLQNYQEVTRGGVQHSSMLLNRDGYWLSSDNKDDEWGFMLGRKERTFGNEYPEAWRVISNADKGTLLTDRGLFVFTTAYPLRGERHSPGPLQVHEQGQQQLIADEYRWKIVSFVPRDALTGSAFYNQPLGRVLLAGLYLLLALAAFVFARIWLARERAQEELRDSAVRIKTVLDNVADSIITIDGGGIVQTYNLAAVQMFGYATEEIIGKNISVLVPAPHAKQHDAYLKRYIETGETHVVGFRREVEGRRKDGSLFPMELAVGEMRLRDQRYFVGIVRDITERRRAEQTLRASEERYRTLFESMDEGFCVVEMIYDQHGKAIDYRFIEANPAFETQTDLHQVMGKTIRELVPDSDAQWFEIYDKVVKTGESIRFEQASTARQRFYDVAAFRVGGDTSRRIGILFKDITKRIQDEQATVAAKEKAELASRAKDSFLATMSHEIRTPLTGMLGMLELLSMTELDDKQHETLDAAWESGRGLLRIVSDILDWSKIEEGKLALAPRATSIPQLLQEVVNTYSRVASAKNLVLWQHADARLSAAHIVDPLRLSQVLNNFVSNAIKFTQRGEVELRAELLELHESGERIRFSVKDTGAGISREVQQHLFQRYRQESADTARMYGGTGLGLAICRHLGDLLDGQIELVSEPGNGATFSITLNLPVSGAPGEAIQGLHPEVEQRAIKPLLDHGADTPLILAVDDHPINRDLLARQIELLGLRADTAENGQQALQKWKEGRYALVITDCHMPEMDGYEFTRALRKIEADEKLTRIPVVAWTANALAEEVDHCRQAGMDELLVKPTTMAQLKKVLVKWLEIAESAAAPAALPGGGAAGREAVIDHDALIKVVPDRAEHERILHEFQSHMIADFAKLSDMLEHDDRTGVERIAHRMKGSSRMVGSTAIASACAEIEQAARAGKDAGEAIARLEHALEQFEAYIQHQKGAS